MIGTVTEKKKEEEFSFPYSQFSEIRAVHGNDLYWTIYCLWEW